MRQRMTNDCAARIVMGGKMEGYSGIFPGIIEEAWRSLQEKKPLYLLGGFGGAARALCDLVLGKERNIKQDEARINFYTQASTLFPLPVSTVFPGRNSPPTLEEMGEDFHTLGKTKDLGTAFDNGLNDAENRILMTSIDARTLGRLLLKGLFNKLV
jgi:hypothetical protein